MRCATPVQRVGAVRAVHLERLASPFQSPPVSSFRTECSSIFYVMFVSSQVSPFFSVVHPQWRVGA